MVEMLSACPSGWKVEPSRCYEWMKENMGPHFPLCVVKDVREEREPWFREKRALFFRHLVGGYCFPLFISGDDHRALLDLVVAGDGDAAAAFLKSHIDGSTAAVLATLSESASPG